MVAVLPSRRSGAGKRDRQNARRFSGGHFAVLGMVGIYKKEIGFRGAGRLLPSGMSMKKLLLFQAILETKACYPFG